MVSTPINASIKVVESDVCDSPEALAQAFGTAILIPTWWPLDVGTRKFSLRRSQRPCYQISSVRTNGAPICVIGWLEVPDARTPRDWLDGDWLEPAELVRWRGAVGRVGDPHQLQAVIYDERLEIQLIGYATQDEILRVVSSLRLVAI
jgi:hypothetical protein